MTGPLTNVDNFFIVADIYLDNIYQVDATTGATAQLLPFRTALDPYALAYDSAAKLLYFTDVADHTINRYSLLTNSTFVIYRDPFNTGLYEFRRVTFVSYMYLHKMYIHKILSLGVCSSICKFPLFSFLCCQCIFCISLLCCIFTCTFVTC